MTDKEMTIEEALELAVVSLLAHNSEFKQYENDLSSHVYKQAAAVLRQIGDPVERSEVVNCDVCRVCGYVYNDEKQKGYCDQCDGDGETRYTCEYKPMTKLWTETPVLKRVIEKSEPVYSPVSIKNEGGRDE